VAVRRRGLPAWIAIPARGFASRRRGSWPADPRRPAGEPGRPDPAAGGRFDRGGEVGGGAVGGDERGDVGRQFGEAALVAHDQGRADGEKLIDHSGRLAEGGRPQLHRDIAAAHLREQRVVVWRVGDLDAGLGGQARPPTVAGCLPAGDHQPGRTSPADDRHRTGHDIESLGVTGQSEAADPQGAVGGGRGTVLGGVLVPRRRSIERKVDDLDRERLGQRACRMADQVAAGRRVDEQAVEFAPLQEQPQAAGQVGLGSQATGDPGRGRRRGRRGRREAGSRAEPRADERVECGLVEVGQPPGGGASRPHHRLEYPDMVR